MSHIVPHRAQKTAHAVSPARLRGAFEALPSLVARASLLSPGGAAPSGSLTACLPLACGSRDDTQGIRNRQEPDALALAHVFAVYLEGDGPGRSERDLSHVMQTQNAASAWRSACG